MMDLFRVSARFALLCLPQLVVSWVAIRLFVQTFNLPEVVIELHLATLAALQALFFLLWSALLPPSAGTLARRLYPVALFLKSCGLNLLYLGSFVSNQVWGSYLSAANLTALLPHLQGFHLAFGRSVFVIPLLAVLLLGGQLALLTRLSPHLIRHLQATRARTRGLLAGSLVALAAVLVAAGSWFFELAPDRMLRADPVLSFWTDRASAQPLLTTASLADIAARRNYRAPDRYRRRNLVVITVDCLRSDRLSFRGYSRETMPYLASLAAAGRLQQVDFAISNGNDSPQGILAVLGSRHPERQGIHNFKLPDLLKDLGYRTHLIGTGDHTTFGNLRRLYGSSFDLFSDGVSRRTSSVNDDHGLHEAVAALAPADGQPAFFFFHLMSPHSLAVREERFAKWQPALLQLDWGRMILGGFRADIMSNTYDNGLLQADYHLQRLLTALADKGYLRDSIVVITGDHGEALGEHGHFGHTRFLYMEDIDVPILFLDSDGVAYGRMPLATQVDIAPTLLGRLGLPSPPTWEGRDLLAPPGPDNLYATGKRAGGWRVALWRDGDNLVKYHFHGNTRSDFRELLFNLTEDPMEKADLSTTSPGLLARARARATAHFAVRLPPES